MSKQIQQPQKIMVSQQNQKRRFQKDNNINHRGFRRWLEKNNLINDFCFKIIEIILIGGVGGVFLYLQWDTANMQTKIIKFQNEPVFSLSSQLIKPDNSNDYTERILIIENVGGIALEPYVTTRTWIKAWFRENIKDVGKQNIMVPLIGYYSSSYINSGAVSGRLLTSIGHNNNLKWYNLQNELREVAKTNGLELASCILETYVGVNYINILGEEKSKYYKIDNIHGGYQISNKVGQQYVEKKLWPVADIETSTVEDIFNLLKNEYHKTKK